MMEGTGGDGCGERCPTLHLLATALVYRFLVLIVLQRMRIKEPECL